MTRIGGLFIIIKLYTPTLKKDGASATASKDNKETIPRFENYLLRLINHQNKTIRTKFENFPADIILMILKRAFL